jgi:hypothetical protein
LGRCFSRALPDAVEHQNRATTREFGEHAEVVRAPVSAAEDSQPWLVGSELLAPPRRGAQRNKMFGEVGCRNVRCRYRNVRRAL